MVDVNAASYPAQPWARHMLHIGVTRAAHQLWLVSTGDPSTLIPAALRDGGRMGLEWDGTDGDLRKKMTARVESGRTLRYTKISGSKGRASSSGRQLFVIVWLPPLRVNYKYWLYLLFRRFGWTGVRQSRFDAMYASSVRWDRRNFVLLLIAGALPAVLWQRSHRRCKAKLFILNAVNLKSKYALRLDRFRERCVQSLRTLQISTRDLQDPVGNVTVVWVVDSIEIIPAWMNDGFLMVATDSWGGRNTDSW